MRKRFYVTIIVVVAGLIALQFFSSEELVVQEVEVPTYQVTGYEFYGLSKGEKVKNCLQEIDGLLKEKKLSGDLGVWYFGNPDQGEDSMRIVVGAFTLDTAVNHSEILSKVMLTGGKAVRAEIDPFTIFAPTPDEVTEALIQYGKLKTIGKGKIKMYAEKYVLDTAGKPKVWNELFLEE